MRKAMRRLTPPLVLVLAYSEPASDTGVRGTSAATSVAVTGVLLAAGHIASCSNSGADGVLKLELSAGSYRWSFITTSNTEDSGTGTCH